MFVGPDHPIFGQRIQPRGGEIPGGPRVPRCEFIIFDCDSCSSNYSNLISIIIEVLFHLVPDMIQLDRSDQSDHVAERDEEIQLGKVKEKFFFQYITSYILKLKNY
jgi:hypothetical protein